MKVLESSPSRYDRGIKLITLGQITKTYSRLLSYVKPGDTVLDVGCGTGAITVRAALKGAAVKGIDINPQMIQIAHDRVLEANVVDKVNLVEMGVAELDSELPESYDVIICSLCLSELSTDEIEFTLKEIHRILKPDGIFLIADEVRPKSFLKWIIHQFIRIPLLIITYILTQTSTKSVKNLEEKLTEISFITKSVKYNTLGNFVEIIGKKDTE
ncbi:MAG: corrinoid protein-associated methyltransferase CpaM [Candidatus Kariarchaeaceae archaeon]|jgi:demethylmenaquinone methyltransferase/2-methoxy-6-polyprenyl-1,4-benzoquinol methylase